ncbi:ABC transporter permease [Melissococcus plutonius]|uniref:ABC transporter permease n=1 Tax=Melissococcus plutonius TaxID=33970 RepID=UPI003C2BC9C5
MFLAINEIFYSKLRYILIIGVVMLIAYLVFFLTGLAYGLAEENREAIDRWQADQIVLSQDANATLDTSSIAEKSAQAVKASQKAYLTQTPEVIVSNQQKKQPKKINVRFLGIEKEQFLMPNLIEGKAFKKNDEAIGDISLKKEYGLHIGDTIKLAGNSETFKLVGFTEYAKLSVSPVVYISLSAAQQLHSEDSYSSSEKNKKINAIIIRGEVQRLPNTLEKISISTFIKHLPGYQAQLLTFGFMIGFLIVIAATVIGIFIYVLTIQKSNIFGIMKTQGITEAFIIWSLFVQTFLLTFTGILLGFIGTLVTSLLLPEVVPFQNNWLFFSIIAFLMLLMALLGTLFSVRTIIKIDPLKVIGQ